MLKTKSSRIDKIYTPKQQEIYKRSVSKDWYMLILHGSVRSGKTVMNNDLFLKELIRVRKIADKQGIKIPQYILAGDSLGAIEKNVLTELYNRYGIEVKTDKFNSFMLFGVKVVQVGHGNVNGISTIRGMTSYGAYINEGSLANESVFNEIMNRCSGQGARILVDTNPDNPHHWLKANYIDSENPNILNYSLTISDNTFLDKRYVDNLKASTPSGMFYDRNIDGLWVTGDGAVYMDFDYNKHYITQEDVDNNKYGKIIRYFAGLDWGFEHYGSIVVIGETDKGNYILVKEYAEQHQYINYWVNLAKKIKTQYGDIPFYVDSARSDGNNQLIDAGIYVENGNKKVLQGINYVGSLFRKDKFYIIEENVERFKKEIYSYVWSNKQGEDEVRKEYDDVLDSVRYALYTDAVIRGVDNIYDL